MTDHTEHEHHDSPPERRPSLEGIVALAALGFSILTAFGSLYVGMYRVTALEEWRKELTVKVEAQREKDDARFVDLERQLRTTDTAHGTRLTVLEERYTEIKSLLEQINSKLDDQAQPGRHR